MSDLKVMVSAQRSFLPRQSASAIEALASMARPRLTASDLEVEASLGGRGFSWSDAKSSKPRAGPISEVSVVLPIGPFKGHRMVMFDANQTEPLMI